MTDRDYLVNILKCFYFLKRKSKDLSQEILRLDLKIENERIEIAAHKCDTAIAGDGCSVHCSKPLSVSYLIDKQMEVNEELKRINEKIYCEMLKIVYTNGRMKKKSSTQQFY